MKPCKIGTRHSTRAQAEQALAKAWRNVRLGPVPTAVIACPAGCRGYHLVLSGDQLQHSA